MPDNEEDKQIEAWTYLGRRFDTKMYYAWEQPNGKEGHFTKTRGTVVGGIYSVLVNRTDSDVVSVYANPGPQFTNQTVSDEQRAVYEARDREAYTQQQRAAAEKRLKSSSPLDEALEPLLAIAANCKTFQDMRALNAYVQEKVSNAFYKSSN